MMINPSVLKELICYDPATGVMTWKVRAEKWFESSGVRTAQHKCRNWNACFAGRPAINAIGQRGVRKGEILGQKVLAHRVAYAIHHGIWPEVVDHINGDPSDNRIENLRSVTLAENNRNLAARKGGSSVHQGVSFDKTRGRWVATVGRKHLGRFETEQDALAARQKSQEMTKFHENHGRNQKWQLT